MSTHPISGADMLRSLSDLDKAVDRLSRILLITGDPVVKDYVSWALADIRQVATRFLKASHEVAKAEGRES